MHVDGQHVQGLRDVLRVEVAAAQHPLRVSEDQRVVGGRVDLGLKLALHVGDIFQHTPMNLGQAAQAVRVLAVRVARVVDAAGRHQVPHQLRRDDLPNVPPHLRDLRVVGLRMPVQSHERHRGRDVRTLHALDRQRDRLAADSADELRAVDQSEAVLGLKGGLGEVVLLQKRVRDFRECFSPGAKALALPQDVQGDVRERNEVPACAHGALVAHVGHESRVEEVDELLERLEGNAAAAL
mmetsp:Transcript_24483/g.61582  ORF Transcript_24483/g.61582 Transcript_24483/m.61582 type:complete len:239 (-) Transcript_24483:839-1555(-)